MSTISVKTHFAAGHRILGLTGAGAKCRNVHGHTFHVTWVFAQDESEMALEFGELKSRLKGIITQHFDHAFILHCYDDFEHYLQVNGMRYYLTDNPPTTEVIAAEIARLTIERLTKPVPPTNSLPGVHAPWPDAKLLRVVLEEGPENCATWEYQPLTFNVPVDQLGGGIVYTSEPDPLAGMPRLDPATWGEVRSP
jgi:6-pyruvoyltetrahydropterin/6-carboxytetrahydropterin synthase